MADVTKEKIINIKTQGAEKNVKSLKTQIRELKEQLAQLDKGTAEYDRVSKQLADTNQKQIEVNEAMKYSNKDLGATLSNLTRVSAGVVGAISSINSVMVLMGADSEEAMEAMKTIQSLMAIIQGLSAIDTATKALKGLTVAFKGFNTVKGANAAVTAGAATAEALEAGVLVENTKEMELNNKMAELYDTAQQSNTRETNESTGAILDEANALTLAAQARQEQIKQTNVWIGQRVRLNRLHEQGAVSEEEYQARLADLNKRIEEQKIKLKEVGDEYRRLKQAKNEDSITNTTNTTTENANTNAINANTLAKQKNAEATGEVVASETALGNTTKKNDPILRKAWSGLTTGIKNAAKALKSFIVANPILAAVAAAVALVAGAVALVAHNTKKALADLRAETELNNELNHSYEEQQIRLNILLRTAKDETQTVNERKKAIDELNKLIPNYNAELDKTTGKYKENTNALNLYLSKLREKIELEAYEGRIKDLLQQRLELEQKLIKVQTSGWNLFGWRVNSIKKDIKEIDKEMDKMYKKIDQLYLPWALDENNNKNGNGGGIKKTFAELFNDLKSLWKEFYKQITQTKEFKGTGNALRNSLMEAINGNLIADKLSDQFRQAMKKGFKDIDPNEITPDFVFDENYLNGIREKVEKEKETLQNLLKQKNVSQEIIDQQKKKVQETQKELDKVNEVTNAAKAEAKATHEIVKAREELAEATVLYNKQLDIERNYVGRIRREQYREFQYEETNKEIEQQRLLYKNTMKRLDEEKNKLEKLNSQREAGLDVDKEILQTEKNIAELQKTGNEAQMKMDDLRYQKRLTQIQEIYSETEKQSEATVQQMINERTRKGGGVADYNTEYDAIVIEIRNLKQRRQEIEKYYADTMEHYQGNAEQLKLLEAEKQAAITQLEKEMGEKRVELAQAEADKKLAIQQAYVNTYQMLSGQLSSILGETMNYYEENSKEYLNLRYAQGVTDTISGTISAYMSGYQSGLKWPANQILAGVLAASTFAMGVMQLSNMKNGTLSNSATATPVQIGSEYDTLSYMQNAEILSNIQDQRVWVSIHDIQDTGHRVEVMEQQATF